MKLTDLPPVWSEDLLPTIREEIARSGRRLVVLDDDPTGTQSVAGLPVLTRWEAEDLDWALAQSAPAVYVLTNTRSLGEEAGYITAATYDINGGLQIS